MTGYFARFFGLIAFAYFLYTLSQEPEIITDYTDMGTQSFDDIVSWGRNKLAGPMDDIGHGSPFSRPGDDLRKHLENLLREEEQDQQKEKEKEEAAAAAKEEEEE
eukprot:CAMPEP_0114578480 /NCGR_PEP_ID=MMETSP0125-20121206/3015_1 /TAXON_ID=485358 ORGANISM="Aristerostoma sp., Strain ATCC 50986" /NCGR_SAMPLE_ID=MMETSP0125 /ASSEMBLY_ACC=CAM_ASM_000245 /LENGTH=104 /DNA_ID=CAMNT_0001768583 /DNA_START=424 /DNA_END=738 /DNA_ORIENTATION=-